MYPILTDTPAGCTGNRQSRSIGEDGDPASDGTLRVLLYMDRNFFTSTFRYHYYPPFVEKQRGYTNKSTSRNIEWLLRGMALRSP